MIVIPKILKYSYSLPPLRRWVTVPRNAADRPKFTTIQNNVAVQVPVPVGVQPGDQVSISVRKGTTIKAEDDDGMGGRLSGREGYVKVGEGR